MSTTVQVHCRRFAISKPSHLDSQVWCKPDTSEREDFLNGMPIDVTTLEMQAMLSLVRTLDGLTAFRTEWTIFDKRCATDV
eukprot:2263-Amphidinium_carterae.1